MGIAVKRFRLLRLINDHWITLCKFLNWLRNDGFKEETRKIVSENNWKQFTWYFQESTADFKGALNLNLVANEIALNEADYYMCGPVGFMEAVVKQLESHGVSRDRIHYEVFGPHAYL